MAFRPDQGIIGSLEELGVEAIFLGAADTPFQLNDSNNQTLGEVRASSFYLAKDGQIGSVQQIDLMV